MHQLGAAQRWRHDFQGTREESEPEDEPLLSVEELRRRWQAEWKATDAWLPELTGADLEAAWKRLEAEAPEYPKYPLQE